MITKLKYLSGAFTKAVLAVTHKTYTFGTLQYAVNPVTNRVSIINTTSPIVFAGSFVVGKNYTIALVGTTDFTAVGAAANTVGLTFIATGVGAGDGRAREAAGFIPVSPEAIVNI